MWWFLVLSEATAGIVHVPGDAPTISDGVDQALVGDVVEIDGTAGPFTETVFVNKSLTIVGTNNVEWRPVDAAHGALWVDSTSAVVELSSVVLDATNLSKRLVHLVKGELTLSGVTLRGGVAPDDGGAILAANRSANVLTVADCVFEDHRAPGAGGAIALIEGTLTIERTTFARCTARDGGAVHADGTMPVTLSDVGFDASTATDRGGGLNLRTTGAVDIQRATFVNGSAAGNRGGGAIYVEGPSTTTVTQSVFRNNTITNANPEGGGAVHLRGTAGTFAGNTWCGNTSSGDGGALAVRGGSLDLSREVFLENDAAGSGGAVFASGGTTTMSHVSILGGETQDVGSAIRGEAPITFVDGFVGFHTVVQVATSSENAGDVTVATSGWWQNAGGDWDGDTTDQAGHVTANPLIGPTPGSCDRETVRPALGSPLIRAASDNLTMGAMEGPSGSDTDGDGYYDPQDCDDTNPNVHPGATEVVANGIDDDCDGIELCYRDLDQDSNGESETATVPSADLDCDDRFESDNHLDLCPGHDDLIDSDADGVPDGCDACPDDWNNDSDLDGTCDSDDLCPGEDDRLDTDGDGTPNGCDTCDSPNDSDGDGVQDDCDTCPGEDDTVDTDGDGRPDGCDPCPLDDPGDTDGDGVCDADDACQGHPDSQDSDADGVPNDCDPCPQDAPDDTDGDGVCDADDICPSGDDGVDTDGDGTPDACEPPPPEPLTIAVTARPSLDPGCGCGGAMPATGWGWLGVLLLVRARRRATSPTVGPA
ncbi:MAG: right-handed parallel beta-helix repeat-containing protein [Alphaproteobacteria bacterium]|nr:right-handed parallel beta-helix repeat-containing protein [Alphaproteobacteria bacterium]